MNAWSSLTLSLLSAGDSAAIGEEVHWYEDWVRREDLTHEYWTQQSHAASVADVAAPVSMITGWYDIFLPWQHEDYAHLLEGGRSTRLILGPWGHTSPGMATPTHIETIAFLKEIFAGAPASRQVAVQEISHAGVDASRIELPVWVR